MRGNYFGTDWWCRYAGTRTLMDVNEDNLVGNISIAVRISTRTLRCSSKTVYPRDTARWVLLCSDMSFASDAVRSS